jgi:predicted nuclease of predicted toxin-antitoxin system
MLSFLVDTQLPPVLARWLKAKGCDAVHTTYFPNGHLMTDVEIQVIAVQENRIIVSKDGDFFVDFLFRGAPPRVLFLQFGNCANRTLLSQFETYIDKVQERFEQGAGLVLFSWNKIAEY